MSTTLQVRLTKELREQAEQVVQGIGLDLPTAVRMFLTQMVNDNGLPFIPKATKKEPTQAELDALFYDNLDDDAHRLAEEMLDELIKEDMRAGDGKDDLEELLKEEIEEILTERLKDAIEGEMEDGGYDELKKDIALHPDTDENYLENEVRQKIQDEIHDTVYAECYEEVFPNCHDTVYAQRAEVIRAEKYTEFYTEEHTRLIKEYKAEMRKRITNERHEYLAGATGLSKKEIKENEEKNLQAIIEIAQAKQKRRSKVFSNMKDKTQ